MKFFIAVCGLLAAASAEPSGVGVPLAYAVGPVAVAAAPVAVTSPVASQFHVQDVLGQYSYGYANPLSAKTEARAANGVTVGGYSYVDGGGKLQSVEYSSDGNGFRVAATNIPVPPALPAAPALPLPLPVQDTPEVIEARAKHLAAVEEIKVRSSGVVAPIAAVPAVSLLPIVPAAPAAAVKSASASTVEASVSTSSAKTEESEALAVEAKSAVASAAETKSAAAPANSVSTPAVTVKSFVTPALSVRGAPLIAAPVAFGYSINSVQGYGLNPAIITHPAITAYSLPLGAQLLAAPVAGSAAPAAEAAKETKEGSD